MEQDHRQSGSPVSGASKFLHQQQQQQLLPLEKGRIIFSAGRRISAARVDLNSETCNSHHQVAATENHLPKESRTEKKDSAEAVAANRGASEKHPKTCNSHLANNSIVLCNPVDTNCATKLELTPRNSLENHCGSSGEDTHANVAKSVFNDQHSGSGYSNQSASSNCNMYEGYTSKVMGSKKSKTDSVLNHHERLANDRLHHSGSGGGVSNSNASNSSPSHSESLCLVNLNHSSSPVAKIFSVDSHALKQVIEVPSVCLTATAAATTCGGLVPKPSLVKSDIKLDNSMLPSLIPSVGDVYCESIGGGHVEDHFVRVAGTSAPIVHHTKLVTIASDSLNLHALNFAATAATGGVVQASDKVSAGSSNSGEGLCGGLAATAGAIRTAFSEKPAANPNRDKITENGNALSSEESSLDSELSERDSPSGGNTSVDKPTERTGDSGTETTATTAAAAGKSIASSDGSAQASAKVCSVVVYEEEEEEEEEGLKTSDSAPLPSVGQKEEPDNSRQTGLDTTVDIPQGLASKPEEVTENVADMQDSSKQDSSKENVNDKQDEQGQNSRCDVNTASKKEEPKDTVLRTDKDALSNQDLATGTPPSPTVATEAETNVATTTAAVCNSLYANCTFPPSSSLEETVQPPEEVSTSTAHPGGPLAPAQVVLTAADQETTVKDQTDSHQIPLTIVTTTAPTPTTALVSTAANGGSSTVAGLNVLSCNRGVFGSTESNKVTLIFKSASAAGHQLATSQGGCGSPSSLIKPKSVPIKLVALPPSCGNLVAGRSSSSTFFEIIGQTSPGSHSNSGSPGPSSGSPVRLVVKSTSPQTSPRTTVVVKSVVVTGSPQSLKLLPATSTPTRVAFQTDSLSSSASSSSSTTITPSTCTPNPPPSSSTSPIPSSSPSSSASSASAPTPCSVIVESAPGCRSRIHTPTGDPSDAQPLVIPASIAETPLPTSELQNMQALHEQVTAVCMDLPVIGAAETTQTGDPSAGPVQDYTKDLSQNMQDGVVQQRTSEQNSSQCDLSSPQRTGGDVVDSDVIVVPDDVRENKSLSDSSADQGVEEKCTVPEVPVRPCSSPLAPELKREPSGETLPSAVTETTQPQVEPVLVFSKPQTRQCSENAMDTTKGGAGSDERRPTARSASSSLVPDPDPKQELRTDPKVETNDQSNLETKSELKPDADSPVETKAESNAEVKAECKGADKVEVKCEPKLEVTVDVKEEVREESGRTTRASSSCSRSSSRSEETIPCSKVLVDASESASECSSEDELSLSELANKSRALSGPLAMALSAERPTTASPSARHSRSALRKRKQQQSSSAQQSEESEVEYLYTTQVPSSCRSSSNESRNSSSSRFGAGEEGSGVTATSAVTTTTSTAATAGRTRSSKRTRTAESSSLPTTKSAAAATVRHQRTSKRTLGRERVARRGTTATTEAAVAPPLVTTSNSTTGSAAVTGTSGSAVATPAPTSNMAAAVPRDEVITQANTGKRKTRSGSASTEQPDSTMSSSNVKRRRVSKDCHR